MRRILAISLILVFGLPLISPLFALGGTDESKLPACCRKDGAHHCLMSDEQVAALTRGTPLTSLRSRCTMFPNASTAVNHQPLSFDQAALLFAEALSHPALHRQTEAWARVALAGPRHKRGPPSIRLS